MAFINNFWNYFFRNLTAKPQMKLCLPARMNRPVGRCTLVQNRIGLHQNSTSELILSRFKINWHYIKFYNNQKSMFRNIVLCAALAFAGLHVKAQQVLTKQDAISKALANSKNIQAAALQINQQQQLLKASVNLPNPDVFIEAPTGNFYTPSITQSLQFPTVYSKQYQLQKRYIGLAEKEKTLSENEIKYQVSLLYLSFQYNDSLYRQLALQDSAYVQIKNAASRQFDAGQIDYLQKTFAETQYGEIHNQLLLAGAGRDGVIRQLQYLMGTNEAIQPELFQSYPQTSELIMDSSAFQNSPPVQVYKQAENVSEKNIELQRNKGLPGLAFGYFNQGERSTPVSNRFRFGVTVPLWFWQYKGNINAAKTEYQVNQQKTIGLQQQLTVQLIDAKNVFTGNTQVLSYYQSTGLIKADEIIKTAQRFLASGEIDYINYLRNTNDAYSIKLKYLEAIRNYNQSIITIQYLTGNL